ncbi:hypothetical protein H8E50_07875 [bacterium]|nr:hypothetical protein [bacterium]
MITTNLENEILEKAIYAFRKNTGLLLEHVDQEHRVNAHADNLLNLEIEGQKTLYYADVKTHFNKANLTLHRIDNTQKPTDNPYLLVTRYVNAVLAAQLKELEMQFIDTAGNAYIRQHNLFIMLTTNKPPEDTRPVQLNRAFKAAGLKLIFAFLCNPGLENKPYREIAGAANIALGTVGWIMNDLRDMGYMVDMGTKGHKLFDKEKLFKRWIVEYPERLRPKLVLGKYQGAPGWRENARINPEHAQWGGEVAAANLTKYLKPQDLTLYTDPVKLNKILLDNRLGKDPKGHIEILERFWGIDEDNQDKETVPVLLVYADLIATGNQRNLEAAKKIYEQDIIQLIRED